jgi:hypothetical protein
LYILNVSINDLCIMCAVFSSLLTNILSGNGVYICGCRNKSVMSSGQ